ncbi:hypothetical protein Vau01_075640 [Virgisporangium aurantiacum]|uniref:Uncharacterized protein n=1 Tax=Virgisporangium aurantiacum TaxID=175570 RepID=A0A8J3ZBZ3_9ACTN|nr:hypothetical protein Vau01_075640 [Virgisporangium aurantiacum]
MLISETNPLLTSMLHHAGVRPGKAAAADVLTTVEVFRRFAAIPVDDAASPEDDGDGILAQYGTFDFDGVLEFWADLTRQFIEAEDEDVMWQLRCTLHWTPTVETEALGSGVLWSFRHASRRLLRRGSRPSRLGMGAGGRTGPSTPHHQTRADLNALNGTNQIGVDRADRSGVRSVVIDACPSYRAPSAATQA